MYALLCSHLRESGWVKWRTTLIRRSPGVVVLFLFRDRAIHPTAVAKVVSPGPAVESARREGGVLRRLESTSSSLGIPRILYEGGGEGGWLSVQSGVPGEPLTCDPGRRGRSSASGQIETACGWLREFQRLAGPRPTLGTSLKPWLASRRAALVDATPGEETLLAEAEGAIDALADLPAVPVHGDFWSGNVLRLGRRLGVIDWDLFHFGSPTEDLCHFVASTGPQIQTEDSMWRALFGGSPATKAGAAAERQALDERGLGPDASRLLFTIFLATRLTMPHFSTHPLWRRLAAKWLARGRPAVFCTEA